MPCTPLVRIPWLVLALAAAGCPAADPKDPDDTDSDSDPDTDVDTETEESDDPVIIDTGEIDLSWSISGHPCFGSRTDALLVEADGRIWVGCGTTVPGKGIWYSDDQGQEWTAPVTTPSGYFEDFRANDIWRGTDGVLYVAGDNTGTSDAAWDAVVSLDTSGDPMRVRTVFANGDQVWNNFVVGTFRRLDSGLAVAESLNGTSATWRGSDAQDTWFDAYGWWQGDEAFQLLDLELYGEGMVGCGSTISQPPHVFLPPLEEVEGFALTPVELGDFEGELWDVDVSAEGLIAVGVDQDGDSGHAFFSGADPYDPEQWTDLDLSRIFPGTTWLNGACRSGAYIALVGRFSQNDNALALYSRDGGESWVDITPRGQPALSACHMFADGSFYVVGGQGLFARVGGGE